MHEKFSTELNETYSNEIEDVYNSSSEVFITVQDGLPLTINNCHWHT